MACEVLPDPVHKQTWILPPQGEDESQAIPLMGRRGRVEKEYKWDEEYQMIRLAAPHASRGTGKP